MSARRILTSLVLLGALIGPIAPAFAQAPPPPVASLPDTERRTSYAINSSTCTCSVGFALFGDGTDFNAWVEVWLNGVEVSYNDATTAGRLPAIPARWRPSRARSPTPF